jgi:hypothetical protein
MLSSIDLARIEQNQCCSRSCRAPRRRRPDQTIIESPLDAACRLFRRHIDQRKGESGGFCPARSPPSVRSCFFLRRLSAIFEERGRNWAIGLHRAQRQAGDQYFSPWRIMPEATPPKNAPAAADAPLSPCAGSCADAGLCSRCLWTGCALRGAWTVRVGAETAG